MFLPTQDDEVPDVTAEVGEVDASLASATNAASVFNGFADLVFSISDQLSRQKKDLVDMRQQAIQRIRVERDSALDTIRAEVNSALDIDALQ